MTVIELVFSPAAIPGAARLFTTAVETLGERLNLATEMTGRFHPVIWLTDNEDTPAMGDTTGAMTFQSTILVSIGILLIPWQLDFLGALAAVFAIFSGIVFIGFLLREASPRALVMLGAGSLYIVFVATTVVYLVRR